MTVVRRHPLVRADLRDAFHWYEDQRPGLGMEFASEFLLHYRALLRQPRIYAVRFAHVRRCNFDRFPYALFFVIRPREIWLLALLHASRDTQKVLAARRRRFRS
jgi:plasmid stabilization system protein ParE